MKRKLKAIYHSVRPSNLIITALTMAVAYFCVLIPGNLMEGLDTTLDVENFAMLVFSTMAIMAAGNLVNDFADIKGDQVNEKRALLEGIDTSTVFSWYSALNFAGLMPAIWLCAESSSLYLISVQLGAIVLLLFYSTHLKSMPLAGNLTVSLLCAIVPLLPLIYDQASLSFDAGPSHSMITYLAIFAFILTLMREITKDLEDIEGDNTAGVNTFAIVFGQEAARRAIFIFGIFLLILLVLVMSVSYDKYPAFTAFTFIFEFLPAGLCCRNILKSSEKKDYSQISGTMKFIMIAGITSVVIRYFEGI